MGGSRRPLHWQKPAEPPRRFSASGAPGAESSAIGLARFARYGKASMMGAHIFIDGYNLLWASDVHRAGAIRDFEGEREALIARLAQSPRLAPHQVSIIFDAHKTDSAESSTAQMGGIEVRFTRHGQQADAVLREMAAQHGSGAIIISSDREVARYAEKKGCGVLGSHEFDRLLDAPVPDMTDEADETTHSKKGPARRDPKARRRALARLR